MKKLLSLGLLLGVALGLWCVVHFHVEGSSGRMAAASNEPSSANAKRPLWTCGMHPQVVEDHPGNCPICHMRLTPMRVNDERDADSREGAPAVVIDPAVVQNMGVRTAGVTRGPLVRSIRTVGMLEVPETGLHDVSPKVGGWIERLYANQQGMHVAKGDPLFELYSPDLMVAEEELVGAVRARNGLGAAAEASLAWSADAMVNSAKQKLRLLDVPDADIAAVADTLVAARTVTFRSPASGVVIDQSVVEGSATQAGQKLMRIEGHGTLWLQLQVYEQQMPLVAVGDDVQATVEALPGQRFVGRITFVHPHVDPMSRTVMARAELENGDGLLRPGMYASAAIFTRGATDVVQVPREAMIDTGTRQVVFVERSEGHFEPRAVHTGASGDEGRVEVLDGLSAGETVVTSGQFLFDVESRTAEAIEKLRSSATTHPMMPPADAMSAPMAMPATAPSLGEVSR